MQPSSQSFLLNCGLHAIAGAAFFFVLQYVVLEASINISLLWAVVGAIGAAYVSWSQYSRGSGN